MNKLPISQIKSACGLVHSPSEQGTGYLVAPNRIATCHHVIQSAGLDGEVDVKFPKQSLKGRVSKLVQETDCAIVSFDEPLTDIVPLQFAAGCEDRVEWRGFGFPQLAANAGVPLQGVVLDPESEDNLSRPMITLYSDMVAAGMAAPVHGYSGSPVVVGESVVGHLSRILSVPGAEGRPAFGVIYAARAANVLALLGDIKAAQAVKPEHIPRIGELVPAIGPGEYHTFISYRSQDRKWAIAILERLEGVGFRVFLDQRELVPGDQLANKLQSALDRSHSGIVLISKGWLDSTWCQEEANALLARANRQPDFRVIPVRLENVELPAFWSSRMWIDFAETQVPEGAKLNQLYYALIGKPPPPTTSVVNAVQLAATAATDAAVHEIGLDATLKDPRRAAKFLELWKSARLPSGAPTLKAAERLIGAGHPQAALEILDSVGESLRAKQLEALALSNLGHVEEAESILAPLLAEGNVDPETAGIFAGHLKREWSRTSDRQYLLRSYEIYREAFDKTSNCYNGINAASLALFLDEPDESRELARVVLELVGARNEADLDHWDLATLGEACLLMDDLSQAKKWYRKAAARAFPLDHDVAVMRRQARSVLEKLGKNRNQLDLDLPVAKVLAFSGHMTDAPGRAVPRFPESKVGGVRREIRERLRAHGGRVYGFSSAARGGDLLFLEEVLSLNGSAKIFLPCPPEEFKKVSVGQDWDSRFDRVLASERVENQKLAERMPPESQHSKAFEDCNAAILAAAKAQASVLDDEEPLLLTVWNGNPGDGSGGTAHAVAAWKDDGLPTENIDLSKLK